jgi:hypothetical protein
MLKKKKKKLSGGALSEKTKRITSEIRILYDDSVRIANLLYHATSH